MVCLNVYLYLLCCCCCRFEMSGLVVVELLSNFFNLWYFGVMGNGLEMSYGFLMKMIDNNKYNF